jgi:hypothetical protein
MLVCPMLCQFASLPNSNRWTFFAAVVAVIAGFIGVGFPRSTSTGVSCGLRNPILFNAIERGAELQEFGIRSEAIAESYFQREGKKLRTTSTRQRVLDRLV